MPSMLSGREVSFFSQFGFVVLPGWFSRAEIDTIIEEGLREIDRIYHDRDGGPQGKWAPLAGHNSPFHTSLLGPDHFLPIAEQLMGKDIYGMMSDMLMWEGNTGWHRDQDVPCDPGVKFLHYPGEKLTAETGAVSFLPGTHLDEEFRRQIPEELEEVIVSADDFQPDKFAATRDMLENRMPAEDWCLVVETSPGDVLPFTTPLYHASFNGASGRMICATMYSLKPTTAEGLEARRQEARIISENHLKMFNYPLERPFHSNEWVAEIQNDPVCSHWIDSLRKTNWLR